VNKLTTALIIAIAIITGNVESGNLSAYNEMPMKYTLKQRLEWNHITVEQVRHADVFLAVADCSRIGEYVHVRIDGNDWQTGLIFDCAVQDNSDGTLDWMEQNNILAEIDHITWRNLPNGQHAIEVIYDIR